MEFSFVLLNIAAFVLAIWQTYKAHASSKEASALLKQLEVLQITHALSFKEHQELLDRATTSVIEQGEKQTLLLGASAALVQQSGDQLNEIVEIRQSLTTKFIGNFDEYFRAVVNLIETAQSELVIFTEFPGLGCFSAPDEFLKYRHTVERKSMAGNNVRVEITMLNEECRLKTLEIEFKNAGQNWAKWRLLKKDKLERFLRMYNSALSPESISKDEFIETLAHLDKQILAHDFAHAECVEIDSEIAICFWLVDGKTAIMGVTPYAADANSYGFATTDLKFIQALKDISTKYHPQHGGEIA